MIEIFIPVLFMCLNGNCNFMQAQTHYKSEAQCRASIDNQKKIMIDNAKKTGIPIETLEGTCINAKVDGLKGQV